MIRQPALAIYLLLQAALLMAADAPVEIPVLIQEDADANILPLSPIIPGIISQLAAESRLNLVVRAYPWRRAQMIAENVEGLLYGAAITQERSRIFHFDKPVNTVNQWLVSSKQAPLVFRLWEDLCGKTISILNGGKYSVEFEERPACVERCDRLSGQIARPSKIQRSEGPRLQQPATYAHSLL